MSTEGRRRTKCESSAGVLPGVSALMTLRIWVQKMMYDERAPLGRLLSFLVRFAFPPLPTASALPSLPKPWVGT